MYPASLTKILSVIIALENIRDLNEEVSISKNAAGRNSSAFSFKKGDTVDKHTNIGNKYRTQKDIISMEDDEAANADLLKRFKPYTIESDKEAEEHAKRFAREVS